MPSAFFISFNAIVGHNLCSAWGMKLVRIPFIIAFVLAASAIGISYLAGIRREAEPSEYLWYDALQELGELCRAKYRQSHIYDSYARHAERDSLLSEAAMFRALAFADNVQCRNCQRAIESLGGRFHAPILQQQNTVSTHTHLHHSLQEKNALREGITQQCLHRAIGEGNRYIARIITWCDASDIDQILILQNQLIALSQQSAIDEYTYHVCPTCGAISSATLRTAYCPHCMTDGKEFHLFQ